MKRFFSFLLSIILCLSMSPYAMAANNATVPSSDKLLEINAKNSSQYALSFIKSIYPERNWSVDNILIIYNEDDAVGGFCIDIFDGVQDNGYIIVKFTNNEPVVSEFSIGPNTNNPYEEILDDVGINNSSVKYYSVGPNEYHVLNNDTNIVFGLDNKPISMSQFNEYREQIRTHKAQILNESQLNSNNSIDSRIVYSAPHPKDVIFNYYSGTKTGGYTITGATNVTFYCDDDVDANGYPYACSIVALCNLMKYYRSRGYSNIDPDFQVLYSTLWTYAGTENLGSTGGTRTENIGPAAEMYLADQYYTCSSTTHGATFYSTFKNALDSNKPCILSYGVNDAVAGHSIFVIGYVNTTAYQYLAVLDGWNRSIRYLNYNGYNYTHRFATTFSIS